MPNRIPNSADRRRSSRTPEEVHSLRAIPYELDSAGALVDPGFLRDLLLERLEIAKSDEVTDSPLFQLLENYPGISLAHDVTEAFRERALWVSRLTIRAHEIVRSGAKEGRRTRRARADRS